MATVFRIDRIISCKTIEKYFARPTDFDLQAYWKTTVKTFRSELPKYPVIFEITESIYKILKRRKSVRIIEETYDSMKEIYQVKILFDVEFEAMQFVFEWGNQIKIIEPQSLILSLKKKANEILEYYE